MLQSLIKFKRNPKFTPCVAQEEDELFANGIFHFNISKLISFIAANPDRFPVEYVEVRAIKHGNANGLDETTVQTADLSRPIILAEIRPGGFNVIDGNHRLERAYRDGVAKIPAYRVYAVDHLSFLATEETYRKYIEYWNSKVEDTEYLNARQQSGPSRSKLE